MSDIIEGAGGAVEGGLFARALEPDTGARKPHPDQPTNCLNCGTPLEGAFCHACGQRGHLHRTISAFVHDLLHGALHLEGKLWRTLPLLIFKPGRLTRRYIDGQRARFVSPMALFLFGVFLMFAVFQMVGLSAPTDIERGLDSALVEARSAARSEIAALEQQLETEELDASERVEAEERLALLQRYLEENSESAMSEFTRGFREGYSYEEHGEEGGTTVRSTAPAEFSITDSDSPVRMEVKESGIGWLDDALDKWRTNPSLMIYKLQANAYKFSWLLIPLSIPFVWLLFAWKRQFRAYDHAIFVTYSLSFMTLLFIVVSLMGQAGASEAAIVLPLLVIPPLHLYKQLRGTYGLRRRSTIWRLAILLVFIFVVVVLFLQLLFFLGAF